MLTHAERIGGPLRPADEHGLALYAPKFGQDSNNLWTGIARPRVLSVMAWFRQL
jgi:hypothetical protein